MTSDYWQQQTTTPLFPDILWARPESKNGAGKLLIIGGNKFGFAAPATAFTEAGKAGVGTMRILLPEGLHKVVGGMLDAHYAPQNPSGSFSKGALDAMLLHASWADGVLLAGELGRNSETAITLETFVKKCSGLLTITRDAADYFIQSPKDLLQRPNTCLAVSYEQLQKIGIHAKLEQALTFSMAPPAVAKWLSDFTAHSPVTVITLKGELLYVARAGRVVSHHYVSDSKVWRVPVAARASVFWLQNPTKPLEAIASSFVPN